MNQIDVRKGLIDNAEQGISEAEKRFYQSYDDRIVQVKSGLTAPVPEEKEVPKDFPELNRVFRKRKKGSIRAMTIGLSKSKAG